MKQKKVKNQGSKMSLSLSSFQFVKLIKMVCLNQFDTIDKYVGSCLKNENQKLCFTKQQK